MLIILFFILILLLLETGEAAASQIEPMVELGLSQLLRPPEFRPGTCTLNRVFAASTLNAQEIMETSNAVLKEFGGRRHLSGTAPREDV